MRLPEYDDLDAIGLAAAIRAGDCSPRDALDAAVERIEARNPALNAVVHTLFDRARARVDSLPDGPLRGVPFLLKDLKIALAGTPTSNSSRLTRDWTPDRSSVLAERYEAAGVQIVGKTNTPEFGIMGVTEPLLRGACRNPWDPTRTPGGSSGGSGSAVAARMVPAAHGGDGGGSIRIPASAGGLFGLKPTRGRVTMAPWAGEAWGGFVQEHVLTRSVRDSALFLDLADQPTPGEPYVAPSKPRPYVDEVGRDPGKLKIAFTRDALHAGENDAASLAALEDAIALLRQLGHEVVEAKPDFPRDDMVRAYFLTVATGVARFVEDTAKKASVPVRASDFEPATWMFAQIAWKTTAPELLAAQQTMQRVSRDVAAFFERWDLMLTPTLARLPSPIGALLPRPAEKVQLALLRLLDVGALLELALEKLANNALAATPNTQLFNQTGQPAMSVPLYWTPEELPVGIQLAARFGDEGMLFRVASQLEAARPWAHRKPPSIAT